MKRLEARIIERIGEFKSVDAGQRVLGFVTARQFFGLDITPFAIELAKVTMMIARKLAIDELHITEHALPLDNLDNNFKCIDALITTPPGNAPGAQWSVQTPWPDADVIIGNPPFLGASRLKPERGSDYVNAVRKLYPDVPGMADYCVYWVRRTHDHLPVCTPDDPFRGRAGLVGTQNIRNNQSRVGGLDHVVTSGIIVEAVENQPWSGEANVHVSIVNWVKTHLAPGEPPGAAPKKDVPQSALLIPANRRLWSKVEPNRGGKKGIKLRTRADKTCEVKDRFCASINSALSDETDVASAVALSSNTEPKRMFRGIEPGNMGFLLDENAARAMIAKSSNNAQVVKPYLMGGELLSGDGTPDRWVIDFQERNILEAQVFQEPFQHVQNNVLPSMEAIEAKRFEKRNRVDDQHLVARLNEWWQLRRSAKDAVEILARAKRYIVCSRVTRRPIFVFMEPSIRPGDKLSCFLFEDDYSYGVLQSNLHWIWFITKCGKLVERFVYSPNSVFDTFPWPQGPAFTGPTKKLINAVAHAGREVRRVREQALKVITGGLRAVYKTLELPGKHPLKDAHAALDAAVLDAYGFSPRKDLLKQLLDLNHAVAAREKAGQTVTAPGVPPTYGDPAAGGLITEDCITPR